MTLRPIDYPPPFRAEEFISRPGPPGDETIEVGVAIVGGGPAGLACAIRLAQLLDDDPAVAGAARRGADRGGRQGPRRRRAPALGRRRAAGAAAASCFPGTSLEEVTSYGPVEHEAVYFLTHRRARRACRSCLRAIRNQGNHVFSLARAHALHGRARRGARRDGAAGDRRAAAAGRRAARCAACARATRGAAARARSSADVRARRRAHGAGDGARRGRAGHALAAPRSSTSACRPENPQIYALGVKEVWRVARRSTGSSTRSAGRCEPQAMYGSSAARSSTRWAPTRSASGSSSGLDYADCDALGARPAAGGQDATRSCERMLAGRGAHRAGAPRRSPRAASGRCPRASRRRARCCAGDAAGFVNVPS